MSSDKHDLVCSNCKTVIDRSAKACPKCGGDFQDEAGPNMVPKGPPSFIYRLFMAVVVLFLAYLLVRATS